jgi:DNA mismatch endonuclease, patch repair protein
VTFKDMTAGERSLLMSRIRKIDTKPELAVRRVVFAMGYRYRIHDSTLAGTPDLLFRKARKIIFVHGCFWHCHRGCSLGKQPKSRLDYWLPKLRRNVERDRRNERLLRKSGWKVLIVWECETKDLAALARKARRFLREPGSG